MPDKPLQIAAYAAGASLAAVTLVYVFAPTFFLDDHAAQSSRATRKRGVVGLANPANDCFMNAVLQTLAGLPDLRIFLIREMHLRRLAGPDVYDALPAAAAADDDEKETPDKVAPFKESDAKVAEWVTLGLQRGTVTGALKDMLDALNERPIYKKTLSADAFVTALQRAFRTRINRSQQDAQEFLQLITERLCDEFYAGRKARRRARRAGAWRKLEGVGKEAEGVKVEETESAKAQEETESAKAQEETESAKAQEAPEEAPTPGQDTARKPLNLDIQDATLGRAEGDEQEDEEETAAFPFEGKIESQIECLHCHYKPKPSTNTFVTLTLHVPQGSGATSLAACLDGVLKLEHIDDFRCARCRIQHALDTTKTQLARSTSESDSHRLQHAASLLETCLATDPEKPPPSLPLPDVSLAPSRRISRHSRISTFPALLAIHLSRSMWDAGLASAKNQARVSFPDRLPLGGVLDRATYRLLGLVTHKGGHNSGHYEALRRQLLPRPYNTPATLGSAPGPYSPRHSPAASGPASPALRTESSLESVGVAARVPPPRWAAGLGRFAAGGEGEGGRRGRDAGRWWRISDDKIKECSTKEALRCEREVYLLFYELVPRDAREG